MILDNEQVVALEKEAERHDGKCGTCHQTIKIYRYKLNKTHAQFLRAMAKEVANIGVNDIDIATIGIAYSVRSQVTKIRQHGLIARVKNAAGAQIPRRWLVTKKGWMWLNGEAIPSKVVIYNNQVLGHDGGPVTIYDVLGERFDPTQPIYTETPVSEPEARIYDDVRQPQSNVLMQAIFKGRDYQGRFKTSRAYELTIKRMVMGKPIEIVAVDDQALERSYPDIAAFQRDWKAQ